MIRLALDFYGAKLRQMVGDELGVEQAKAACNQMRYEMDQRDLAGIAGTRKHALAKKRRPEAYPIEAANKLALMPSLHAKPMTAAVQPVIKL